MLICAIENIVFSIILGNIYGTFGIILASFISKMTTVFWYESRIVYKEILQADQSEYYKKILINTIIMLLFLSVTYLLMSRIFVTNLLVWLVKGCFCTIIINVLYLIRYIKNNTFRAIASKIFEVIGVNR